MSSGLSVPFPNRLVAGEFVLRPVTLDDWQFEQALSRCPDVPQWTLIPRDLDEAHARLRMVRAQQWALDRVGCRYVIRDAAGESMGAAGIGMESGAPEVYYALLPAGRGRGAATEAVRALTGWAHGSGHPSVRLLTLPGNVASEKVARRAGFERGGTESGQHSGVTAELRVWEHGAPADVGG